MIIRKSQLVLVPENDGILYKTPEPFVFDGEIDAEMFATLMIDRMKELGGVGLSANQVGIDRQMFVMGSGDIYMAIFNPEIIETSGDVVYEEGCLSFPGIFVKLNRPSDIKVKFQNSKGEWREEHLSGLSARIFLHEYDHMHGTTFKSRASKLKWDLAVNRKQKRIKKVVKKHVQKQLINLQKQIDDQQRV